nr:hypothetical protein [Cronobacter sakazakii]
MTKRATKWSVSPRRKHWIKVLLASTPAGKEPYELNEYITLLIRQDDARLKEQVAALGARKCGKCGDALPVDSCPCQGDSQCWTTAGWHELKLTL